MDTKIKISICPSCGDEKISEHRKDWTGNCKGKTYTVPSLDFWECPSCGGRIYDRAAMRKIEACSPAFGKSAPERKSHDAHPMPARLEAEPI